MAAHKLEKPLYHGTCYGSAVLIAMEGFRSPIYLTEDREAALHYAKAATAYVKGEENLPSWTSEKYSLFTLHAVRDSSKLVIDDYNVDGEPNQWVYKGSLRGKAYFRHEDFAFDVTPEELLRLQCFAIGMWRR